MLVVYVGNFQPSHSTETHVARSLEAAGHQVLRIQEGETRWPDVANLAKGADLLLWTQTYGLAVTGGSIDERFAMLAAVAELGIPTAGIHLDRWWDLERQGAIYSEPYFKVKYLFTADGGNAKRWADAGVNHFWSPPAVVADECVTGRYNPTLASEIAFVGSHRFSWNDDTGQWDGYHRESPHRRELVQWLPQHWGAHVRFWPRGRAVRGQMLADLYASTAIVVGDSCLVPNAPFYWSDRISETLGRRGFLLHPEVEGLASTGLIDGIHLRTWPAGDWDALNDLIAYYLNPRHTDERLAIAAAGQVEVRRAHTYRHRVETMLATIAKEEK